MTTPAELKKLAKTLYCYPVLTVLIISGFALSVIGGGWIVAGFALWVVAWAIVLFRNFNRKGA